MPLHASIVPLQLRLMALEKYDDDNDDDDDDDDQSSSLNKFL